MKLIQHVINILQLEMNRPKPYGLYHILCLCIVIISVLYLYKRKTSLRKVLFIYSSIAFVLELLKQVSWSFQYNELTNMMIWDYEWYAFPFQLCTTPIYACFIILLTKNEKIQSYLISYLSFITIIGSLLTMLIPDSCFTSDVLVNIHTMWLHGGSLVVSIYLLSQIEITKQNYKKSYISFLMFLSIAYLLNVIIYHSQLLNGETFNMFYISPYFECSLPVFNIIYKNVNYWIFLFLYVLAIYLGSKIIYCISKLMRS